MGADVLHSVTMTYDQDVVDIYNNVYVVSIDDQKDITLDFDVEEGFYGVKTILLRDITEDGEAKNICQTGTKQCSFNATKLIANSGLEIILYDWDDNVVRQTMLGLIIKQNATKEDFEIPGAASDHAQDQSQGQKQCHDFLHSFFLSILSFLSVRVTSYAIIIALEKQKRNAQYWESSGSFWHCF